MLKDALMNDTSLLLPLFAQILLVFIVWAELYRRRLKYLLENKIDPQKLAVKSDAVKILEPVQNPSDNFSHQFEIPVLFYVAILTAFVTGLSGTLLTGLFWGFIVTRYIHAYIQCTSNVIMTRFKVYAVSTSLLWIAWIVMAVQLYF